MATYKGIKTENISFLVEETKLEYGNTYNHITLEDKVISEEELEELNVSKKEENCSVDQLAALAATLTDQENSGPWTQNETTASSFNVAPADPQQEQEYREIKVQSYPVIKIKTFF